MAASIRSATTPIDVRRLGTVDYQDAWQLQRELADARVAGGPDTLLLLEHPSVYTAGRRTLPEERPVDGTPVVDTDRGGKITWHGPGQLVGYPIVGLAEPLDVVNFVRRLEESLIQVCAELGLETGRVDGPVGVWVPCRRTAPGAQGRRDRRPGVAGDDAARVRAELRLRPGRVLGDRAVRHRRRRRHVADRRTRPPGRRSTTCIDRVADAVCDALDGRLRVALTRAVDQSSSSKAASCCVSRSATRRRRSSASRRGSRPGPRWARSTQRAEGPGPARGSAHGLRGSRLPQHLRVLGGPRGHVPDRRRAVHPSLRLLPDRHRQARRTRPRRAAPGRRERRRPWGCATPPSPASPATICPTAARGCTPRRCAHIKKLNPDTGVELLIPDFNGEPDAARAGLRVASRSVGAQRRNRAADLQADPARRSATSAASPCSPPPATTAWSPSPT